MMKRGSRKSVLLPSDSKTTNGLRKWLHSETIDAYIIKSIRNELNEEEERVLIEEMAYCGCPMDEICTLVNRSPSCVANNFKDVINRATCRWRFDLRKAQIMNATEGYGNASMLVWLGKQHLAQKDDPDLDIKKEKFDEFIAWMKEQAPSTVYHQSNATSSSTQTPETTLP